MIQRPRGTRDFVPDEAYRRSYVRGRMVDVLERWGYREIVTPTFEQMELFTLKSGEGVVEEIYSFKDKGGRDLALRPELTAPVMRMYSSELHNAAKPQRLYYYGNCFRYERPQRGRFREFWQLGVELIGGRQADSEAEVIALADGIIRTAGIQGDLHVGYLGLIRAMLKKLSPEHRPGIMRMIDKKEREALSDKIQEIEATHLGLLELIDMKGKGALDRAEEISRDLAKIPDADGMSPRQASDSSTLKAPEASLQESAPIKDGGRGSARTGREVKAVLGLEGFREMIELLRAYGVEATVDFEIVRGLEYYTGTVFEIYASGLGAQSQICGGGTYELASLFGGRETPSTGFGLGFDRIMEVVENVPKRRSPVVLAYTPDVRKEALMLAKEIRSSVPVVTDVMGRSLSAQLKAAAATGAEHVVIVGRRELDSGQIVLREMSSGQQEALSPTALTERLEHIYINTK